jgi:peroxiredoxin
MIIRSALLACAATLVAAELPPPAAEAAAVRPAAVGSAAPLAVAVQRSDGTSTTLAAEAGGKPLALVFYRGGWCPYCVKQLAGLEDAATRLRAAGWTVLALSPDRPADLAAKPAVGGPLLLSDTSGAAMRSFGVAFRVDAATIERYAGYGIAFHARAEDAAPLLPVPAVFLVGADGTVRFAHADADFRKRLDPQALLAAATP